MTYPYYIIPHYVIIEFWIAFYPIALLYALLRPLLSSLREEYETLSREYEKSYKEFEKAIVVK